jgi:hypothetical protein
MLKQFCADKKFQSVLEEKFFETHIFNDVLTKLNFKIEEFWTMRQIMLNNFTEIFQAYSI